MMQEILGKHATKCTSTLPGFCTSRKTIGQVGTGPGNRVRLEGTEKQSRECRKAASNDPHTELLTLREGGALGEEERLTPCTCK